MKLCQGTLDYRHWQIPLSRGFRSLKLWFVLRLYGQEGLRSHIRRHIGLAQEFEALIEADDRFEITAPVTMGLVCFRLRGSNHINESLNMAINDEGRIHITPSKIGDVYFLRFAVCSRFTESADITFAYDIITKHAEQIIKVK